ncbi:MAG TPA: phosphoribosylformylglycinamidine cyclo-ligase [Thermotogota bacterium]|nr:phosphoribosylformylglycinamidine cyclo-ligase [Thermotogota bacterium]
MEAYKKAGVNIEEGYETVKRIQAMTQKTHIPGVLNNLGSFAGMFELGKMNNPVLISGTDGVGTKLEIAFLKNIYDTVGIDCVAMCVNDIICHGAKPLFFLDYLACGKLESEKAAQIVKGVCDGCVQAGCALLGGETAEMPGFYDVGQYDMAGFAVGVAEKEAIINGDDIQTGDVLIGLSSSGLHSNGFSLVRHLIKDYEQDFNGEPIWRELLKPTRIYVQPVMELMKEITIKGIAHITGGGLYENIPRMSSVPYTYRIEKRAIPQNPIFNHIASLGVNEKEMFSTFNMGVGLVICVQASQAEGACKSLTKKDEKAFILGRIENEGAGVCLV